MSRGCLAIMASSKARPQVGQDVVGGDNVVVVVVGDADNEFPPLFDSVAVVFDNIFELGCCTPLLVDLVKLKGSICR